LRLRGSGRFSKTFLAAVPALQHAWARGAVALWTTTQHRSRLQPIVRCMSSPQGQRYPGGDPYAFIHPNDGGGTRRLEAAS
jgi:hypothetical protein